MQGVATPDITVTLYSAHRDVAVLAHHYEDDRMHDVMRKVSDKADDKDITNKKGICLTNFKLFLTMLKR